MDLSISIVNWNGRDLLDNCIASVLTAAKGTEWEVIVVDNASSDDSLEMLRKKHPEVEVIANSDNAGFARANNQAYGQSSGRYFMLLNPDTVCLPGSLPELVRFMDMHPKAGACGPLVLNPDHTLQYSWARFPSLVTEALGILDRRLSPGGLRPDTADAVRALGPFETDWAGGCALVVRREAIEQIGLMDESFFMYSEETDWCCRLSKAGWRIWVVPTAEIVHLGGQSSKLAAAECINHLYNSKTAYFRKHHGQLPAAALAVSLGLRRLARKLSHAGGTDV